MSQKRTNDLSKALLASEMSDQDPDEQPEPTPAPPPTPEPEPMPEPVPVPTSPESNLIAQLIAALSQNSASTAQAIKDALSSQASMARAPIPETYLSGGYPGKSVYSHPDGDAAHPRTLLRCPMFLGVYNDEGKVAPAFEYFPETLTEDERIALNLLKPGARAGIQRHDGQRALWRVAEQVDANGGAYRVVIAVPEAWLGKDQFHQMPTLSHGLAQLLDAQQQADQPKAA